MADIRIKDLPLATGGTAPVGTDAVAIDGLTTRRTTISTIGDVAVPVASQAEAEAGVNAAKRMTPLTTKQSIASEVGVTLASAAEGDLANTALQPGEAATPSQGALADTALQPGDAATPAQLAIVAPSIVADTMLVDNASGTARENKTFDAVKALWDPTNDLLVNEGFYLAYHKARGSWPVKAFGNSKTAVGSGNAAVDTVALQAAMDAQQIIDITGASLLIEDQIDVAYNGANISSSVSNRVGSTASSIITIADITLPKLFNVSGTNFEASGFHGEAGAGNVTTTWFHFERASGSAADIDASIDNLSVERGAKMFHIYGRGLRMTDCVAANITTCVGDIDWPSSWTPNGSSNDLQETGMRAYHFSDMRFHGCATGIRNIGTNKLNCRGIIMDNIMADIGVGGVFIGAAVESIFSSITSQLNATNAGLLFDIHAGSNKSEFIGFKAGGYFDGDPTHTRLSRNLININSTSTNGITDLHFIGGSIGPCDRNGVQVFGGGSVKGLLFSGVSWERNGLENNTYLPISIFNSSGTFTDVELKLSSCSFRNMTNSPTYVVGGLNSNVVTLIRDGATTKSTTPSWAQPNVVQVLAAV